MQFGPPWASRDEAIVEFNDHESRSDGARITLQLGSGLDTLQELFYLRIHTDVESELGVDSMIVPVSLAKSEAAARLELEIYQVVASAVYARHYGYLSSDDHWYLDWLARLRLGKALTQDDVQKRLEEYASQNLAAQRRSFASALERTFREACRAPLIVYRLLPIAVAIVTAMAFDNPETAREARQRQIELLPAITDCRQCAGRVLENGQQCSECGNPFWNFSWLTAVD